METKLSPVAQGIFDSVKLAMQAAEEMGGPEGAEYAALMSAIACEASYRALVSLQGAPRAEYLKPLFARFGEHRGLNADWATMAWSVWAVDNGDLWILDDESPEETVSLVRRIEHGGESEILFLLSAPVASVLAHLDVIQKLKG